MIGQTNVRYRLAKLLEAGLANMSLQSRALPDVTGREEWPYRTVASLRSIRVTGFALRLAPTEDKIVETAMPLSVGTRVGPYEILASVGAGGMGEVYRARDTKLDREVAIKTLPRCGFGAGSIFRTAAQFVIGKEPKKNPSTNA